MSADDNDDRTRSRSPERIGDRAEARAIAAVADAMARARHAVAQADARAKQRIDEYRGRTLGLSDPLSIEFLAEDAVPSLEHADHPSREAIAQRAYYKAQQRRFQPGCDVDDWLQAERELWAGARDPSREERTGRG